MRAFPTERVRVAALLIFSASLPMSVALQQIGLGLLLCCLLCTCWHQGKLPRTPLDLPLLLFLAALLLSALCSPAVLDSLQRFRRLWLIGAFIASYNLIHEPRDVERATTVLVASASIVAAYGVIQHFTGIDLARVLVGKPSNLDPVWLGADMGYRTKGLHPSGITYAHNLLFPLSLALALLCSPGPRRPLMLALFVSVSLMLAALAYSLTRGVWLAAAVVFVAVAAAAGGKRLAWLGTALLVPVAILALNSGAVRQRATTMFDLGANLSRRQIWQANLDMIADRPLLGWGYGNYKRFRGSYYQRYPDVDTTAHAHNTPLQIWVEGGVLALFAFLFLIYTITRDGWLAYRIVPPSMPWLRGTALGSTAAVCGFVIAGLTQYNFGDAEVVIVFWFTAALALRARDFAEGASMTPAAKLGSQH